KAGAGVEAAADVDRARAQPDIVDRVDLALDRYQPRTAARRRSREQLLHRLLVRAAGREEEPVHEILGRRANGEAADVDDALRAHQQAVRVGEVHAAA